MATQKAKKIEVFDDLRSEADPQPRATGHKARGWREIEALRERKFLEESLADVWDEDILIDESVFSDSERESIYYSDSEEVEIEDDMSDFDDEFYDDEE